MDTQAKAELSERLRLLILHWNGTAIHEDLAAAREAIGASSNPIGQVVFELGDAIKSVGSDPIHYWGALPELIGALRALSKLKP